MTVPFVVVEDAVVVPLDDPELTAWYRDEAREGRREVTVEVGNRSLAGKAVLVPAPGGLDCRALFAEKYRDPGPRPTPDLPLVAIDLEPWF